MCDHDSEIHDVGRENCLYHAYLNDLQDPLIYPSIHKCLDRRYHGENIPSSL